MRTIGILVIAVLPMLLGSCTTARIADYRPPERPGTQRTAHQSGLEVAIDPFVEEDRADEYFGLDGVAEGIAILHVRVVNTTDDRTFLVEKKNFQLVPKESAQGRAGSDKVERAVPGGNATHTIGALAAGSVLSLAILAAVSKSTEIQRNFTSKEIADATLSPGKSIEGFLYFTPVTQGEDWSRSASVRASMTDTKTRHVVTFDIPLAR